MITIVQNEYTVDSRGVATFLDLDSTPYQAKLQPIQVLGFLGAIAHWTMVHWMFLSWPALTFSAVCAALAILWDQTRQVGPCGYG